MLGAKIEIRSIGVLCQLSGTTTALLRIETSARSCLLRFEGVTEIDCYREYPKGCWQLNNLGAAYQFTVFDDDQNLLFDLTASSFSLLPCVVGSDDREDWRRGIYQIMVELKAPNQKFAPN